MYELGGKKVVTITVELRTLSVGCHHAPDFLRHRPTSLLLILLRMAIAAEHGAESALESLAVENVFEVKRVAGGFGVATEMTFKVPCEMV